MRLDFSLKEPKDRTLEERQREIREDFQAGRSVEAIVAVEVGSLDSVFLSIERNCFSIDFAIIESQIRKRRRCRCTLRINFVDWLLAG